MVLVYQGENTNLNSNPSAFLKGYKYSKNNDKLGIC